MKSFSNLKFWFVADYQNYSGERGKEASQFLFLQQNILDCFQLSTGCLQSNGEHRNIDKNEKKEEEKIAFMKV